MPKQSFDTTDEAIWKSIVGNKGFLPSARTENLVDILARDLGLNPIMIRIGDDYEMFDRNYFYKLHIRDRMDGFCRVYYHPDELGQMTGSNAHNWLQWASILLGYGRASHDLAPRFGLPDDVREELESRGIMDNGRVTRLLSLELVAFYLASQITTWENPARIYTVKDRLSQQDIEVKALPPVSEDIDVDSLLPEDAPAPAPKRNRYPKAAQGMRDYNPADASPTAQAIDIEDMSDDDLNALAARLMAVVTRRQHEREIAGRRRQVFERQAQKARLIGGTPMPDRGEYASVRLSYKDKVEDVTADTVLYIRADYLTDESLNGLVEMGLIAK